MNELPLNERPQLPVPRPESTLAEKDPSTAFIVEFLGGFFGFMGLGYLYAGRIEEGVVRLVAWWVALAIGWSITGTLTAVLIGCALIPVMLVLQVAVPFWSADLLKKQMLGIAPTAPSATPLG